MTPIIVDNFAGGGGASTGIRAALGRPIDFAINHDREAIAMHAMNHPETKHFQTNVWDVDPRKLAKGRPVDLAWFSPDCTYHSKARGGKPFRDRNRARRIRGLAWLVQRWVRALGPNAPRVVMLENVEEFKDWGPLNADNTPSKRRRGQTFRRWHAELENLGYRIDMREMRACDYGAPTYRKRLFVVARRDEGEIVFPEPTHGPGLSPFRTTAECIDWSIPCPSIFDRNRPLAENTMRRIARGVQRFVIDTPTPFIVPGSTAALSLINTRNGEREGQAPRVFDPHAPFPTVTAVGSQGAVVAAFLARHYGGHENDGAPLTQPCFTVTTKDHHALVTSHILKLKGTCRDGQSMNVPMGTIQAQGNHWGEVRAFLMSYYGTEQAPRINGPAPTVRTKEHLGIVTVKGLPYAIVDIGMRMLTPRELYRIQGFGDDYVIDFELDGKTLSQKAQVRMCGNSVSPYMSEALVRANVVEQEAA